LWIILRVYIGRFQMPYSYTLFNQVCILLEFLGDGAVKVVSIRNSKVFPDMSLRVPSKDTPTSRFPLQSPYIEKDVPFPEPSFTYLYKSTAKEPPFRVPLAELPQKETLHLQSLLLPVSQSPQ
jgi:hypothetical protein